jgi:hypothetical protein
MGHDRVQSQFGQELLLPIRVRELPPLDQLCTEVLWLQKSRESHSIEKTVEPRASDGDVPVHCVKCGFLGTADI